MSSNQSEMDNEEVKKHDNEKLEFKFTEKHWIPPTINTTNVSHHVRNQYFHNNLKYPYIFSKYLFL